MDERREKGALPEQPRLRVEPPALEQPRSADGRFRNLDRTPPHRLGSVFRWAVVDRLSGRRRRSPPRALVPVKPPDFAALARPPGPGQGARLTWIGHASWLLQLDGLSLLVDPVFSERLAGRVRRNVPAAVPLERLPRVAAALVTHNHYDHLDLRSLRRLGVKVVAGLEMSPLLAGSGLAAVELGWWQRARLGPVAITFVPAQHWSRRGLTDTNRTLWGGFVVEGSTATVYHAGDTAWFAGFAEIGRRIPRIDAALLPIGAYDPPWFMEKQHMNPEQAVAAFAELGAGKLLAMHWGTFKLSDEPLDEPPARLEAERRRRALAPESVRAPAIGETIEVRRPE